jgi:hypothetical protein
MISLLIYSDKIDYVSCSCKYLKHREEKKAILGQNRMEDVMDLWLSTSVVVLSGACFLVLDALFGRQIPPVAWWVLGIVTGVALS